MTEFPPKDDILSLAADLSQRQLATVAARAALRLLPALRYVGSARRRATQTNRRFELAYFRCAAEAWADSGARSKRSEGGVPDANRQLSESVEGKSDEDIGYIAGGVAYFARELSLGRAAFNSLLDWQYKAEKIVSMEDDVTLSEALIRDIRTILEDGAVSSAKLWVGGEPKWFDRSWRRLKDVLLERREGWELWVDWFERRIRGARPGLLTASVILDIPDELWGEGPDELNRYLHREIGIFDLTDRLNDPQEDARPPAPGPGPYAVSIRQGKLEAEPTPGRPVDNGLALDLRNALQELAVDVLNTLSDNLADPPLTAAIQKLLADLSADMESLPLGRLQIDLRVLQGFSTSYSSAELGSDRTIHGLVSALAEGLYDLTSQYNAIRQMEAGRIAMGVVSQADIRPLQEPVRAIVEAAQSSDIVGDSLIAALTEGNDEIASISNKINNPLTPLDVKAKAIDQRAAIIGQQLLTVWNFGVAVVQLPVVATRALGKAAADGAVSGVKKGVEGLVAGSITGAAGALAFALHNPVLALSYVAQTFAPLAQQVSKHAAPKGQASSSKEDGEIDA